MKLVSRDLELHLRSRDERVMISMLFQSEVKSKFKLSKCSGEDDVIDRDEHKLYKVADKAHYYETHSARVQNLEVFLSIRLFALSEKILRVPSELLDLCCERFCLFLAASGRPSVCHRRFYSL